MQPFRAVEMIDFIVFASLGITENNEVYFFSSEVKLVYLSQIKYNCLTSSVWKIEAKVTLSAACTYLSTHIRFNLVDK